MSDLILSHTILNLFKDINVPCFYYRRSFYSRREWNASNYSFKQRYVCYLHTYLNVQLILLANCWTKSYTISSYHTEIFMSKPVTNWGWKAFNKYKYIASLPLHTRSSSIIVCYPRYIICSTLYEYPLLSLGLNTHAQTHTHIQQQRICIFACTWYCSTIVYLPHFKCTYVCQCICVLMYVGLKFEHIAKTLTLQHHKVDQIVYLCHLSFEN